jgi:uncharacterized protein Yka (UPF0111/DUF47 family)
MRTFTAGFIVVVACLVSGCSDSTALVTTTGPTSISAEAGRISDLTARISALEGHADELHDVGLRELYQKNVGGSGLAFFVGNEVYDHLEKVVDRFDDVANVMHGIVIEHV